MVGPLEEFEHRIAGYTGVERVGVEYVKAPRALAGVIARIAMRQAASEAVVDPALLDPAGIEANYVRRSDAELFWKEA
jgi:hypothetical protein